MAIVGTWLNASVGKIALANLVESGEGNKRYKYIATRIYDAETGMVTDEVLESKGQPRDMPKSELCYAMWQELPALDIRTKQLVGKNKDKYCTLISVRVYRLPYMRCSDLGATLPEDSFDYALPVRALGYTLMDINGDKQYLTVKQFRESDILQCVHSVGAFAGEKVCRRKVMTGKTTTQLYMPTAEIDDTDTTLEDIGEVQAKLPEPLIGSWYVVGVDGVIQVDADEVNKQQLEELEIPDGVWSIPESAVSGLSTVKRIKLPESVARLGRWAFCNMENLEVVNMPSQVDELHGAFGFCKKLKCLDLSHIAYLRYFEGLKVERLLLPDAMCRNKQIRNNTIDVLEFRNVTNATRRVLGVEQRDCTSAGVWKVGRIETNGPVVLGNYSAIIHCVDASALEPNIVGIAPNCRFSKVDAEGNPQPWLLGPTTEFIYSACEGGYKFTDEVYAMDKLKAITVSPSVNIIIPKSVDILQGKLSESMCGVEYPNVVYAAVGLYSSLGQDTVNVADKLPSLRWVLPGGKPFIEVHTEERVRDLERKLTPILPELCRCVQEVMELDLTQAKNLEDFKCSLLCDREIYYRVSTVFYTYGMIYVGDYGAVLGM